MLLISAVQQSDSVIHIYILFYILFHDVLSQDIEYSSLCSTVGTCCLSILCIIVCIIVCICSSQTPNPSSLPPLPLRSNHKSVLCVCESLRQIIIWSTFIVQNVTLFTLYCCWSAVNFLGPFQFFIPSLESQSDLAEREQPKGSGARLNLSRVKELHWSFHLSSVQWSQSYPWARCQYRVWCGVHKCYLLDCSATHWHTGMWSSL